MSIYHRAYTMSIYRATCICQLCHMYMPTCICQLCAAHMYCPHVYASCATCMCPHVYASCALPSHGAMPSYVYASCALPSTTSDATFEHATQRPCRSTITAPGLPRGFHESGGMQCCPPFLNRGGSSSLYVEGIIPEVRSCRLLGQVPAHHTVTQHAEVLITLSRTGLFRSPGLGQCCRDDMARLHQGNMAR